MQDSVQNSRRDGRIAQQFICFLTLNEDQSLHAQSAARAANHMILHLDFWNWNTYILARVSRVKCVTCNKVTREYV